VDDPLFYTAVLVAASALPTAIAVYAWRARRTVQGALYLAGLSSAMAVYAFGYAFELASAELSGMLWWSRFQYAGIAFIPALWLLFVADYSEKNRFLTRSVRTALFALSSLTALLHWTQPLHRLFYVDPHVDATGLFPLLAFGRGPWYWVHQAYVNLVLLISVLLLAASARRPSPIQRRRARIMLAGSTLPWVFYLAYLLGLGPRGLDLTPFGLILAGPVFAWGVFRMRILDLAPIARESIFDGMRDGVIVLDRFGRLVDLNPAAVRIFPGLSREAAGQDLAAVLPKQPPLLDLLKAGAPPEVEIRVDEGQGERFFQVRRSPVLRGRRLIGHSIILSDITTQHVLREKLRLQASVDDLTGAFNRRHFTEEGRRELARSKRHGRAFSLMIFDLDHFKRINDTFGHETGDRVLAKTAETVRKELRMSDLLGRHGGEEFAVILPETPPRQACAVADRLREALSRIEFAMNSDKPSGIAASFGVSGADIVIDESLEDFVRAADRAMYEAKAAGRNCVRCAGPLRM